MELYYYTGKFTTISDSFEFSCDKLGAIESARAVSSRKFRGKFEEFSSTI
jgi:hypothetical protein